MLTSSVGDFKRQKRINCGCGDELESRSFDSPSNTDYFQRRPIPHNQSILERLIRETDSNSFSTSDVAVDACLSDDKKPRKVLKSVFAAYGWFVPGDT